MTIEHILLSAVDDVMKTKSETERRLFDVVQAMRGLDTDVQKMRQMRASSRPHVRHDNHLDDD